MSNQCILVAPAAFFQTGLHEIYAWALHQLKLHIVVLSKLDTKAQPNYVIMYIEDLFA